MPERLRRVRRHHLDPRPGERREWWMYNATGDELGQPEALGRKGQSGAGADGEGHSGDGAGDGAVVGPVWERADRPMDLLETDMVVPGGIMGGELAERLTRQSPSLKVIYTSGYSPGMTGRDASLLEGRNFLPKPYPIGKLAQFVRECLDTPAKRN